jgi:hypothetical protein
MAAAAGSSSGQLLNVNCVRCGHAQELTPGSADFARMAFTCASCRAAVSILLMRKGRITLLKSTVDTNEAEDKHMEEQKIQALIEKANHQIDNLINRHDGPNEARDLMMQLKCQHLAQIKDNAKSHVLLMKDWGHKVDITVHCHLCAERIDDVVLEQLPPERRWWATVNHTCGKQVNLMTVAITDLGQGNMQCELGSNVEDFLQ